MKFMKKAVASLLAVAMLAGAAGCSGDKSWAMKTDSFTAPIGTYIYYLNTAYQTASHSVKDTSKPVLEQTIDNQSAEAWIKDKALTYIKELFVINDKMKELNLTLTDAETKNVSDSAESQWSQYSSTLEQYGISKNSYRIAGPEFYAKFEKVFYALYGKGGKKEVSDADLKSYFESNYTDFSYVVAPLYKANSNSGYAELTDAEKAALKKEFEGYASDINSGKMTMQQAADAYKTSSKQTDEQLHTATMILNDSSSFPADFKTVLTSLKNGETKAAELTSSGVYILVSKGDITKKTSEYLSGDNRNSILSSMKIKEFTDTIEKEAKEYNKAKVNQSAIDSYKPSMFVTPTSSTAAPAASSAAASSSASSSSAVAASSTSSSK